MKNGIVVVLCIAIVVIVALVAVFFIVTERVPQQDTIHNESAIVSRVIDLDTFELSDGRRVRLLCVNAPEREQPWSGAAIRQLTTLAVDKPVMLVRDVSDKDTYGRLLRFVYLDGVSVQHWLVQNGFARVEPFPPDTTYCGALEAARAEAASQGRGIWAAKPPICNNDIYECDDFATKAQATLLFGACGGTNNDVHKLDGDRDGIACEELV